MSNAGSSAPRPRSRLPLRLLAFGLVAVAAFALGFLVFGVEHSRILVRRYGYYTICLTFVWALVAWGRIGSQWADSLRRAVTPRERWQAGWLIAALTLVALLTVPIGYKILYDEMVLQATAVNMHRFREVSTLMRAYMVDGVFAPFDAYVDKRPFFFPYIVSLLHDVTGYRENNAFFVNLALMPVVLGQVYLIARRFSRHVAALAAVIALGTLSTFAHSATGAGMEMLNLAMILLVVQLSVFYLEQPAPERIAALVMAAVLLAQTRYESSLYVGPVACVILEGWRRSGRIIMPVAAMAAPLLLVPYAVHNTYLSGTPLLWELHENATTRFGLDHFVTNLVHAAGYFFGRDTGTTNSLWLSLGGLLAAGYAVVRLWRGRKQWRVAEPVTVALPLVALGVIGNLGLLMFYYWGQLDDPTVMRLSLPFSVLLALALAFAIEELDTPRRRLVWISAGAAFLSYLYVGLLANEQHTRMNTLLDELDWERRYVNAMPPGDRLIITNTSSLPWMLQQTPAVSIEHARRRVEALRYQFVDPTFRDILVFQTYRPTSRNGDFVLQASDRLPDWFVLEPVVEKRFGTRLVRMSRLASLGKPPPPPASR